MNATTVRKPEPNETTKAAIREAQSGKNPNRVYSDADELIHDILDEEA